jgi:hypothetical protein
VILLDSILLDEQILTEKFSCDLQKCKGACCTLKGGSGAPLADKEIDSIQESLSAAMNYLPESHKQHINENGWFEVVDNELATQCIDESACVFVFWEQDIAKCALERAFFNGESKFRKPLSCHLYPIRVADFGGDYLYYDVISECEPALAHGKVNGNTILDTTSSALLRAYGKDWVDSATALSEELRSGNTNNDIKQ